MYFLIIYYNWEYAKNTIYTQGGFIMKVRSIKLIELIDHVNGNDEEYTYTSRYKRNTNNSFIANFSCTSKVKVCPYCGDWLYDESRCTCGEKQLQLSENDVIERLEESLNDSGTTKIKINGTFVN